MTRTIYHLIRWQESGPESIKILSNNFLNRKLLKALDIEFMNKENQLQALSIAMKESEKIGLNPSLSCGLRHTKIYGYRPYEGGLRIWDGHNLMALEKESNLVENLISPTSSTWLIYPKEIAHILKSKLIKLRGSKDI